MSFIREFEAGSIIGIPTEIFTMFNREKFDPNAIPKAWGEFWSKRESFNEVELAEAIGATLPSNSMDIPMTYVAGLHLPANHEVPDGMTKIDFPSGKYFCVRHSGPINTVDRSYNVMYIEEFPASGHEMRNAPHLEIYNPQLNPMDINYEMVIAVPIN